MKPSTVEAWVWVLVYGGLLLLVLGLFVERHDDALGSLLMLGGSALTAGGALLIVLRSRMKP